MVQYYSFVQFGIEMKDAYAPYWGFSVWDFGAEQLVRLFLMLKNIGEL